MTLAFETTPAFIRGHPVVCVVQTSYDFGVVRSNKHVFDENPLPPRLAIRSRPMRISPRPFASPKPSLTGIGPT